MFESSFGTRHTVGLKKKIEVREGHKSVYDGLKDLAMNPRSKNSSPQSHARNTAIRTEK